MDASQLLGGKVALVTGAGRGIGREIALMMAAHRAAVIDNDIGASMSGETTGETPAEEVAATIRAAAKLGIAGLSTSIALDTQRFGVTSNCIAPFAWSRMTSSIPVKSDADAQRVERLKAMKPEKIAAVVTALAADAAQDITAQIFGVRANEICLFSQPRPIRTVHTAQGWTPQSVLTTAFAAMAPQFIPNERSGDVFCWDPI